MKHNKLVEQLLGQFSGESKVFFKIPNSPDIIPVAWNTYEVDNTLVFFKDADDNAAATVNDLLEAISNNYYTSSEGEDEDFMVAISNIFNWDDDTEGFNNLYCISDAIYIDDKVILTTLPFNDDITDESSTKLTIVSSNSRLLREFIDNVYELKNSSKYSKSIHIV